MTLWLSEDDEASRAGYVFEYLQGNHKYVLSSCSPLGQNFFLLHSQSYLYMLLKKGPEIQLLELYLYLFYHPACRKARETKALETSSTF